MYTIIQKIKWPLVLCDFVFKNFNTNYRTLELLNLKEFRLREIRFSGGHVKELSIDLFPVSVENLTLMEMGIHELSASFESLKNLYRLSIMRNRLKRVSSVELPVSSLEVLDLSQCNLRMISPFLVSMLEKKNQNPKLTIDATGNLNVNINDVRKIMKAIKGLSLELNRLNETIRKIANKSYRLEAIYQNFDP
ncbi:hypothetical protein MEQ_05235 [Candida albicans P87]|nr:hypothetical protein MEQ_05235 [Candida albicans P87]